MENRFNVLGGQKNEQASRFWDHFEDAIPSQPSGGLFGRLKETFLNLFFEESNEERPIGISQLGKKSFQTAAASTQTNGFYRPTPGIQDYRFVKQR